MPASKRKAPSTTPTATPALWPPASLLPVGTHVVWIGNEVVEITAHLTPDASTKVLRAVRSADEPVTAYQVRTRTELAIAHLDPSWGYRTLTTRENAEAALAVLRGSVVTSSDELVARGIYNKKAVVVRSTTLQESAELLRYWYSLPEDAWNVAMSMRTHGFEREVFGELAIVLGMDVEAIKREMRSLHPVFAAWEAGAAQRAEAQRAKRLADDAKKPRRKSKSLPLP